MNFAQDKIDLIEKIIKTDRKFANNEDLYEDFLNETCKRSLSIVNTISSDATLEIYLRKIVTTSIINVLKNEGRLRRTRSGYIPVAEVPAEQQTVPASLTDYSKVNVVYEPVSLDDTPEDAVVKKDILQKIVDTVLAVNEGEPEKRYYELYYLRYEKGMTQSEIANELELSQSEVSKRLFRLMDKVKQAFN